MVDQTLDRRYRELMELIGHSPALEDLSRRLDAMESELKEIKYLLLELHRRPMPEPSDIQELKPRKSNGDSPRSDTLQTTLF